MAVSRSADGVRGLRRGGGLGTFGGVFTPSILTILGIILFLRLGYVVGNAGLGRALLILAIATSISVLTSSSLSAIATNRKVRGGGDYYLISRSLGVAYGGALGLILFAAQSVSVAFYCIGFGEAVAALVPGTPPWTPRAAAAGAAAVLLGLAYVGADLATRFQYVIMAILAIALASFFTGGLATWDAEILRANWATPPQALGFWAVFAIFFPAVTGFTQGVSMSGDLADPGRSLPNGTFAAVGLSTVVYVAAMFVLAAALPAGRLASDYGALQVVATHARLIDAGVLAATLSSALASFLGAPRILHALASDRVFTRLSFLAHTSGPSQNPRRAVLLTGGIAFVTIALGNLNAIAGLVSMFFLISYGLLNYATYIEASAASPSFRPRFRFFHTYTSLAGTLLCGSVMLAIDPGAGVVAVAIVAAIYQYVTRTAVPSRWRDSRRAYRFRRVKEGISELAHGAENPMDWQPQILVFTESPERRERVLRFAAWISGGSGMTTAVQILEGQGTSEVTRTACVEAEKALQAEIEEQKLDAFPLVVAAPDVRAGAHTLVQSWGIGPIRANTVLLNWYERPPHWHIQKTAGLWYTRVLRSAVQLDRNVVVLNSRDSAWEALENGAAESRRIDVWWWDDESSRLALLLAYLMTRADAWDESAIRLCVPVSAKADKSVESNLTHRLEEGRITATIETVVDADAAAVTEKSKDAAVVFLPLRIAGMRVTDPFGGDIEALLETLPVTALVAAAQDVPLKEEEPAEAEEVVEESGPEEKSGEREG